MLPSAAKTLFALNAALLFTLPASRRDGFGSDQPKSGNSFGMGMLWGLVRTIFVVFAVIVAALVAIDGTLLANLLRKKE